MTQTIIEARQLGVPCFPCRSTGDKPKNPAVGKGADWREVAKQPLTDAQLAKPIGGAPVPQGLVILDFDSYKTDDSATPESLEQLLGVSFPWDAARLQTTMSGGQHFCFRAPYNIKNISDIELAGIGRVKGLDTRVGGQGYVCFGQGYTAHNGGVYRFANPERFPEMPPEARKFFEFIPEANQTDIKPLPTGDRDINRVIEVLRHIDPSCDRITWRNVGYGLRHQFHDNDELGIGLFDAWSRGAYTETQAEPDNYVAEDVITQWSSFKAQNDGATITFGTVIDYAKSGEHNPSGAKYIPPNNQIDIAAVFGQLDEPQTATSQLAQQAEPQTDGYKQALEQIRSKAGNSDHTRELVRLVFDDAFIEGDRIALRAELAKLLKESGLLTNELKNILDPKPAKAKAKLADVQQAKPLETPVVTDVSQIPEQPIAGDNASSVHGINAQLILREIMSDRAASFNGDLHWWSGRNWQLIKEDKLNRVVSHALMGEHAKSGNISGTASVIPHYAPSRQPAPMCRRVFFDNGVLQLSDNLMYDHVPDNNNLSCLAVSYEPWEARPACNEWLSFLEGIWGECEDYAQRVRMLQQIFGWLIVNSNLGIQKCVALDGVSRGGKGTILNVIAALHGYERVAPIEFSDLGDDKEQSNLINKSVGIDFDAKSPERSKRSSASSFFNKVTANDPVSIKQLYKQQPWQGRLDTKLIFACNGMPILSDDSAATANRAIIVKFDKSFLGREDAGLSQRIIDNELAGITAWAVEGLQDLVANDCKIALAPSSVEASELHKESTQSLLTFVEECLVATSGSAKAKDVYRAYEAWAAENNFKTMNTTGFKSAFVRTMESLPESMRGEFKGFSYKKSMRIGSSVSSGYTCVGLIDTAQTAHLASSNITQGEAIQ